MYQIIENYLSLGDELMYVRQLINKGGPDESERKVFANWFTSLQRRLDNQKITLREVEVLQKVCQDILTTDTVQGFAFQKPYGYSGDFEVIDKIYKRHVSGNVKYAKWDEFFQETPVIKGLRNRKSYFKNLVKEMYKNKGGETLKILSVASGSCREIQEMYEEMKEANIVVDAIAVDEKSVYYAKGVLGEHQDKVRFQVQNIFEEEIKGQYDLVWSAGLFDYFDNKAFKRMLRKLLLNVNKTGQLAIGSVSSSNPSKPYLEIFCKWYLHHRAEDDLLKQAKGCGLKDEQINIEYEEEKVSLFLRVLNAGK